MTTANDDGDNDDSDNDGRRQVLELVSTVSSGGLMPTSVAFHRGKIKGDDVKGHKGLLYVLNAGVPNNITGFTVGRKGELKPLSESTRQLSAGSTSPAQVGFDDDGKTVIVTERGTNLIDTYTVGRDGRLSEAIINASAGPVPFGFAVNRHNTLFVSEAGDGGGASTYDISRKNGLTPVSSILVTGQRAACWAVVTKNGRFAYVTNTGTGNISGFAIDRDGSASLLDTDGVTAETGGNPTDAAVSKTAATCTCGSVPRTPSRSSR